MEEGYPKLANLMAWHPEASIFRRFSSLNALNLLHMQAELVHLETELREIVAEDIRSGDPTRQAFAREWWALKEASGPNVVPRNLQWEKLMEMREKLEKYNTALLQQAQLRKLDKPLERNADFLREWLERPECGKNFLQAEEAGTWSPRNTFDFVALLGNGEERDTVTKFVIDPVIGYYHRRWGALKSRRRDPESPDDDGIRNDTSKVHSVAETFSTVLSSTLPTLAIFVLYFVHNLLARLGAILVFTTLFSVTLTLISTTRRVEIFSATAAFAAVQVVFVGSTSYGSSRPG